MGTDLIESLPIFWSTPNAHEVVHYQWDTDVPQVTQMWPQDEFHRFDLRTVVQAISGRFDLTNYLYELRELEALLDETTNLEAIS